MRLSVRVLLLLSFAVLLLPSVALGYGGPGSVISGIGAFLAAIAAVLAAVFGFLWYPLKRLYRKMTTEDKSTEEPAASQTSE
jgi:preprotein translocase subunit SecG